MEEAVGKLWHRWITRAAQPDYPEARVELKQVQKQLGLFFRAFGGTPALAIQAATREQWRARRSLLERIAGREWQVQFCWVDDETLFVPGSLALFPEKSLNETLYFWLTALAATQDRASQLPLDWLEQSLVLVNETLRQWPGLRTLYAQLASAHIAQRHFPPQDNLARQEQRIQRLIQHPEQEASEIIDPTSLDPIPLWLHPFPPQKGGRSQTQRPDITSDTHEVKEVETHHRRAAKRKEHNKENEGLLAFRLESLFSWAEFTQVDRPHEEDEDLEAEKAANDLDEFAVSNSTGQVKQRLKFDLDLPGSDYDDFCLLHGMTTPEWDYRKQLMMDNHCQIEWMQSRENAEITLPDHLRKPARRIRAFFEHMRIDKQWLRGQPQGSEIDWDAYLSAVTAWKLGHKEASTGLFKEMRRHHRNLSCLLLADLSLSTEAAVDDQHQVIDVIRDGLFLMSEALQATGDRHAIAGFSSRHRHQVRYYPIKGFNEGLSNQVRGRIQAIRPGLYTRMGAAIRVATQQLAKETSNVRLLLLLSDGKPNDVDRYDGRYGIEDTRKAIQEALQAGITPFCITIDNRANEYLPYLFGQKNYVVIRNAKQLPQQLPQLYARLTESL